MIDYTPTITALADRIERNGPEGLVLGPELKEAIRDYWRRDINRAQCATIMDAFPRDFPLYGARGAE